MTKDDRSPVFELKNISYSYSENQPVLKNIRLTVRQKERVCILGANGCGKSTLLKIFAGLLFSQSGSFEAFGSPVTEKQFEKDSFSAAYHNRVGFIFQDSDVQLFCSTVEEEIAFGLMQQNLLQETVRRRVRDVTDMLGIGKLLDQAPFKLSGGEKKKVALASVLAMNPEVFILDEPTNGLDPRTQAWLINLLDALHNAGKTIVSSTHNLELVTRISDRSILFAEDHTIASDRPTKELVQDTELLKSVNFIGDFSI